MLGIFPKIICTAHHQKLRKTKPMFALYFINLINEQNYRDLTGVTSQTSSLCAYDS